MPEINLWGLLIEDIEYFSAYFKTKFVFLRFNSGSDKYQKVNDKKDGGSDLREKWIKSHW